MEVRNHVLKGLEAARQEKFIGAPLEASVHLKADGGLYPLLEEYAAELPALFIVSQVAKAHGGTTEVQSSAEAGTTRRRVTERGPARGAIPPRPLHGK